MRAVNLLPDEFRPGSRWTTIGRGASARRVLSMAGIAAGVLVLAFAGLTLHQRGVASDRQAELQDVQAQLAAAQAQALEGQQAQAASAARYTVVQKLVAQRIAWDDVLRDLARVLPHGVFLQGLQAAAPTPTGTTAGAPAGAAPEVAPTAFTVSGSADSQIRVARVLDRLSLLPWLSDVTLQSSVRGEGHILLFTIGATIGSTGGR
jgi:Tfp pilus assembly protein PilN